MAVTASAQWTDGERFIVQASSRHAIVVDSSSDKTANGPMELVLMALCSCTATDVVSILKKKREPFTSLEVRANGERAAEPPTVYTKIHLVYRIGGKVTSKAAEDAVQLSKNKYCSVSQMLQKSVPITYEIEYID
jgi:putative redox protein